MATWPQPPSWSLWSSCGITTQKKDEFVNFLLYLTARHQSHRSHIKTVLKMVKLSSLLIYSFSELTNIISWNHRQLIWILLFFQNIEICVLSSASALFSYCSLFKLMRPSQETKGTRTPQGATRTSTTPSRARTTTRARLAATTIPGVRLAVPLPRLHLHKFIYWLWRLVAASDAMDNPGGI